MPLMLTHLLALLWISGFLDGQVVKKFQKNTPRGLIDEMKKSFEDTDIIFSFFFRSYCCTGTVPQYTVWLDNPRHYNFYGEKIANHFSKWSFAVMTFLRHPMCSVTQLLQNACL
jgi:hypothetical protein